MVFCKDKEDKVIEIIEKREEFVSIEAAYERFKQYELAEGQTLWLKVWANENNHKDRYQDVAWRNSIINPFNLQ
jgi:hypothetical protein